MPRITDPAYRVSKSKKSVPSTCFPYNLRSLQSSPKSPARLISKLADNSCATPIKHKLEHAQNLIQGHFSPTTTKGLSYTIVTSYLGHTTMESSPFRKATDTQEQGGVKFLSQICLLQQKRLDFLESVQKTDFEQMSFTVTNKATNRETNIWIKRWHTGSCATEIKTLSTYENILNKISAIQTKYSLSNKDLALIIRDLSLEKINSHLENIQALDKEFLTDLTCLLYIVECERHVGALFTVNMFLDLVIDSKVMFNELPTFFPNAMQGAMQGIKALGQNFFDGNIKQYKPYNASPTVHSINTKYFKELLLKHKLTIEKWMISQGVESSAINLENYSNYVQKSFSRWFDKELPRVSFEAQAQPQPQPEPQTAGRNLLREFAACDDADLVQLCSGLSQEIEDFSLTL